MANVDLVMRLLAEDRASDKFKKVGDSAKRTETQFTNLGRKAATALAGIGLAAFAKQSIDKFAAVQDAQSALQATYGKTADAFIDFANNSADALNLSKREALDAATTFANFGRAAGLAGKDLQKFTTPLIERAADAASYFGGSTSDAIEAFGAALRGEMEPIRRYGVLLDDATLRAKALEMGLVSSTKNALTPQTKTLAAQALILEKTSQAQGDVARTSDSMANQIKDAAQQMDDFQTSVGETLSVAVGPLLQKLNGLMGTFNRLPQPVKTVTVTVGALTAAGVLLLPRLLQIKAALAETSVMAGRSGIAIKGLGKAFAAVAITQAVAALDNYKDTVNSNTDDMAKLLTQLGATGQGFDKLGYTVDGWTESTRDFNSVISRSQAPDWLDKVAQGIGGVIGMKDDLTLSQEALASVDNALADMVKSGHTNDAAMAVAQLRGEYQKSGGDLNLFDGALSAYQAAIKATVAPTAEASAEVDHYKDGVKKLKDAFTSLQGILDKRSAARSWKGDLDEVGKAVKDAGGHFNTTTAKGRAFQDFIDSSVSDLATYAQSFKDPLKQQQVFDDGLASLRRRLAKMGLSDKEIAKILKPFKAMRSEARTAGAEVAAGLAAGMDAKGNIAIARARALGKATALAVKDGAQVNSPSRITIEAGSGLMEGVEVGAIRRAGLTKKLLKKIMRESLSGAQDALERFRARGQEALDFINGIKDSIKGFGSIAAFQSSEDAPATTTSVLNDMASRVAQAKKFGEALKKLKKLGLNNSSLQEIIAAGPRDGLEIAEALLAGGLGAVRQVNSLEAQLGGAAQAIGDVGGLSQYGLTGAQAKAIATTTISVAKGGIVINFGSGIDPKSKHAFEDDIERIIRKIMKKMGKRALGGPVSAGSTYVVGENQAELFTPSRSGVILPSASAGAGTARVNVYLDSRLVQSGLVELERQQGGLYFGKTG